MTKPLVDSYARPISYLRLSVTDRCDLRCAYCMPERMVFLPKAEVLTLEELDRLASAFIRRGVRKLRLTGGEPLGRRDLLWLIDRLGRHLGVGLEEITLTTNATQLARFAAALYAAGVRRVNVSLDTLDRDTFARIARRDALNDVLAGIAAAQAAGLHVKLNVVALKHDNAREIPDIIRWGHARGFDVSLIETMPLGEIEQQRTDQYLPLSDVRAELASFWTLTDLPDRPETKFGGPARYVRVAETGGRLGFITPLTHNFCESCNRVRVTCTGRLYTCLGRDDGADLRAPLRASENDDLLDAAIADAVRLKPKGHDFVIERKRPAVARHMSMTGG